MNKIFFLLGAIFVPIIFNWWLFVPIAILFVSLVKFPYMIVLAGFILDSVYYFGNGFFLTYPLTLFSLAAVITVFFLSKIIHWPKPI
jgi:hypothetical protein